MYISTPYHLRFTQNFQAEEIDENNMQVAAPGFHVVFLPFAEDFRTLHLEEAPKGLVMMFRMWVFVHFVERDSSSTHVQ